MRQYIYASRVATGVHQVFVKARKERTSQPQWGQHASAPRAKKERQVKRAKKKKGIEAQKVKPPTPNWETDVLIRNEEKK